ncbi:MAG: hypothetical protein A3I61_12590 [Acidobacteria bacterium RIFCSPLOWO2_02_FULL_68_18]|nr:MAG: hypothetical protein A3I61_12590 [Acidobacteria bacterium RIFCSPLOWO2_02_FULL_68_18]OFW50870.1 MAG: hypothetical protein A3G77_00040 [Acidobacteria bacterium RIFCSPLOWO2_12_FULL_68_19]
MLLVVLYRSLDIHLVGQALLRADPVWLIMSIGMILPITVLRAIRFFRVAPPGSLPGVGEALRLTLAATALNVFAPAKSGDLIKSYFVAKRSETSAGVAVAIIVYERLSDLFALIAWCLLGWVVGRPQVPGLPSFFWVLLAVLAVASGVLISSARVAVWLRGFVARTFPHRRLKRFRRLAYGWPDLLQMLRGRRRWIVSYSLFLWLVHLVQIWLFTVTLSVDVPFTIVASLSAVALMAGQLPFTIAGLGTRDVVLVLLLSRYVPSEPAAAMGVLISTRNLLPPLLGLPVMWPYLSLAVGDARKWWSTMEQTG